MAKNLYLGVGGAARRVSKIYLGVGGVARKVKKGFLGVGGVARLFFEANRICSYYGTLSNSYAAGIVGAGFSYNQNYALLLGGYNQSASTNPTGIVTVNAYNSDLVRSSPTGLSLARYNPLGGCVGQYALALGGIVFTKLVNGSSSSPVRNADAYNASLTRTVLENLPSAIANGIPCSSSNAYFIYATTSSYAYAYNTSLTRTSFSFNPASYLSWQQFALSPTGDGEHVLIAGGHIFDTNSGTTSVTNQVYALDTSLTAKAAASLSLARYPKGSCVGEYAMIVGGSSQYNATQTVYDTVDLYSASLTKLSAPALSVPRAKIAPGTFSGKDYTVLAGGANASGYLNTVDIYDKSLLRTTQTFPVASSSLLSAPVGDYLLFENIADSPNTVYGYKLI